MEIIAPFAGKTIPRKAFLTNVLQCLLKMATKPKPPKSLPQAVITQMLALATSGFGLVAALAWNEVVKETITAFIKPYLPQGSNVVVSLLIYAVVVTVLAVSVTLHLTKLQQQLQPKSKR